MDPVFLVIEGCLALFAIRQGYLLAKFISTRGIASALPLLAMTVAVGGILLPLSFQPISRMLAVALAAIASFLLAVVYRCQLGAFSSLESPMNHVTGIAPGRRGAGDMSHGAVYYPNALFLLPFLLNYLVVDSEMADAVSVLGTALVLPVFMIKLVGQRRL